MTRRVAYRALAAALALAAAAPGAADPSPCGGHPCCRREQREAPAFERASCCAVDAAPEGAGSAPAAVAAPAPAPALPALTAQAAPAIAPRDGDAFPFDAPRATGPPLHLRLRALLC